MHVRSLCALLVAALPAQEPAERPDFAALEREYNAAQRAYTDALRSQREQPEAERTAVPRPETVFQPRFAQGAAAHAGTAQAVPFLVWLVSRGSPDAAKQALSTLFEHHVEDPGIRFAVARIGGLHHVLGAAQSRAWLDAVLEQNRDPAVQNQARYTRAAMSVGTRAVLRSDELRAQAIADLEHLLAAGPDPSLRGLATNLLDEAQRLEPGLPAPDIEGEDLDGVRFKLSDYKGKVVLLDFWGDW